MTEYHIRELKRAQEVEKRGRELWGEKWRPSRWHIKLILKAEADRNRTQMIPQNKRFGRGWSRRKNKRNVDK